jgi:hypothetical protein
MKKEMIVLNKICLFLSELGLDAQERENQLYQTKELCHNFAQRGSSKSKQRQYSEERKSIKLTLLQHQWKLRNSFTLLQSLVNNWENG